MDLGREEVATCRGDEFQVSSIGRFRKEELSNFSSSSRLRGAGGAIGTSQISRTEDGTTITVTPDIDDRSQCKCMKHLYAETLHGL